MEGCSLSLLTEDALVKTMFFWACAMGLEELMKYKSSLPGAQDSCKKICDPHLFFFSFVEVMNEQFVGQGINIAPSHNVRA